MERAGRVREVGDMLKRIDRGGENERIGAKLIDDR